MHPTLEEVFSVRWRAYPRESYWAIVAKRPLSKGVISFEKMVCTLPRDKNSSEDTKAMARWMALEIVYRHNEGLK